MDTPAGQDMSLYARLARADETYANLPHKMMLAVEKLSKSLPEPGARLVQKSGSGMEFHQIREFDPNNDDVRFKNARKSGKGVDVLIEWQPEIRHSFFLHRDASPSTNFSSLKNGITVREAEEIMLLALARHIARQDDNINIIGNRRPYHGSKSPGRIAANLTSTNIMIGGDIPAPPRRGMPADSTAIFFSDAMAPPEQIEHSLKKFSAARVNGHFIMVIDPEVMDQTEKGVVRFMAWREKDRLFSMMSPASAGISRLRFGIISGLLRASPGATGLILFSSELMSLYKMDFCPFLTRHRLFHRARPHSCRRKGPELCP